MDWTNSTLWRLSIVGVNQRPDGKYVFGAGGVSIARAGVVTYDLKELFAPENVNNLHTYDRSWPPVRLDTTATSFPFNIINPIVRADLGNIPWYALSENWYEATINAGITATQYLAVYWTLLGFKLEFASGVPPFYQAVEVDRGKFMMYPYYGIGPLSDLLNGQTTDEDTYGALIAASNLGVQEANQTLPSGWGSSTRLGYPMLPGKTHHAYIQSEMTDFPWHSYSTIIEMYPIDTASGAWNAPGIHYKVIHDVVSGTTVKPADQTIIYPGEEVYIVTEPINGRTMSTFLVDGVEQLPNLNMTTGPVAADVHITSIAAPDSFTRNWGEPVTITCSTNGCCNISWSADFGGLTGLTIDANTGVISGTIPDYTPAQDYTVTITLTENGNVYTKDIIITVTEPPIIGSTWTLEGSLGGGTLYGLVQETTTDRVWFAGLKAAWYSDNMDGGSPTFTAATFDIPPANNTVDMCAANGKVYLLSGNEIYELSDGGTQFVRKYTQGYAFGNAFISAIVLANGNLAVSSGWDGYIDIINTTTWVKDQHVIVTPNAGNDYIHGKPYQGSVAIFAAATNSGGSSYLSKLALDFTSHTKTNEVAAQTFTLLSQPTKFYNPDGTVNRLYALLSGPAGSDIRPISSTDDGATWSAEATVNGATWTTIGGLAYSSRGSAVFSAGSIWQTTDFGVTWSKTTMGSNRTLRIIKMRNKKVFIASLWTNTNNVYRSVA